MEETNFVLHGMTDPHRTLPTIATSDEDPGLIQANIGITQAQQVVPKLLHLVDIHRRRVAFILEVLEVDVDEWRRGPEI
jgi:hypothetical protein